MLRLYRRHVKACRFHTGNTNGNRNQNNCRCPIYVDGRLQGERVNKPLDTRNWKQANEIIRDWEIEKTVTEQKKVAQPVREACDAFLADVEAQHLSVASIKKYRVLLINQRLPE